MSFTDVASYIVTLIAITLAPGPVALMLIVRSASKDVKGALSFGLGFALGGVLIIAIVCFGLGNWLSVVPESFEHSKYLMMAYILWLARGVWKGRYELSGECSDRDCPVLHSASAGMFTCFISPYMMILFPLVLPGLMDITVIKLPEFAILAVITFTALAGGSLIIIACAAQISRIARSPRSMLVLRRCLSSILVLCGFWMVFT